MYFLQWFGESLSYSYFIKNLLTNHKTNKIVKKKYIYNKKLVRFHSIKEK